MMPGLYTTRLGGASEIPPMGYAILFVGLLGLAWLISI